MSNLTQAFSALFKNDASNFVQRIRKHGLNCGDGPTFLKDTNNMLAGQPEELDFISVYARAMLFPVFDLIDGCGIYHTNCLPKKYWTKKMRNIVTNGDPKSFYGCAAGDIVIVIDNIPYYIDIKISEKNIQQKDNGEYIYFTGSIPISSLNNFPTGDGRHLYMLFPRDLDDSRGKICMVDADALVNARDNGDIGLRNKGTAYLAQDMLKLQNAGDVIMELV